MPDGSFTSQALSLLLSLLLPCTFTSDSGFRNLKDTRELEKRKSGAVGRDICRNGTKSTKSRPRNLRRRPTFAQILSSTTLNSAHKRCRCQQRLQQRLEVRSPCRIPDLVSESVVVVICKRPMSRPSASPDRRESRRAPTLTQVLSRAAVSILCRRTFASRRQPNGRSMPRQPMLSRRSPSPRSHVRLQDPTVSGGRAKMTPWRCSSGKPSVTRVVISSDSSMNIHSSRRVGARGDHNEAPPLLMHRPIQARPCAPPRACDSATTIAICLAISHLPPCRVRHLRQRAPHRLWSLLARACPSPRRRLCRGVALFVALPRARRCGGRAVAAWHGLWWCPSAGIQLPHLPRCSNFLSTSLTLPLLACRTLENPGAEKFIQLANDSKAGIFSPLPSPPLLHTP